MNVRDLIDGIVQQTTVLIAQVATSAGIRAPLAHVADQVFVELAREIEAQGVGRKIVADMFGLALRSYQIKMQRISESASVKERSLWEAVLDFLRDEGSVSRQRVLERFARDPQEHVRAVLNDLVGSGLAYSSGRGEHAIYGLTQDDDRRMLFAHEDEEALAHLAWLAIYRARSLTFDGLCEKLNRDRTELARAVAALARDGRISRATDDGVESLRAAELTIPVGAELGWESAVLDHFRAVASAIGAKLRNGRARSSSDDVIGGATLSFDIAAGHPHAAAVYGLLRRVRADVNALWNEVTEYNRAHPLEERERTRVYFYFGQSVDASAPEAAGDEERAT